MMCFCKILARNMTIASSLRDMYVFLDLCLTHIREVAGAKGFIISIAVEQREVAALGASYTALGVKPGQPFGVTTLRIVLKGISSKWILCGGWRREL